MWIEAGGTSIAASKVVAVESLNDLSCAIYTESRVFTVHMPKDVVLTMIDSRIKGHNSMSRVEELLTQIYQGSVTPRP